jgi:outer membrane receptor protein involved in Fe transport
MDTSLIFAREHEIELDFFALFGHVDYQITDTITIGGGLRYYESDQRTVELETQAFQGSANFAFPPAFGGPFQTMPTVTNDSSVEEDEITFDAVLSYQPNDDQLYYFRAASGFRPGGTNAPGVAGLFPGIVFPATFAPDTVESFEVGAKTSWFDNRLTLNAAYFKMLWDDIHVPGEEATGAFEFIANAASADIDGVEVEIVARPTDQWLLTFGVTWMDAALDEDQDFPVPLADIIAAGAPLPPLGVEGDDIPKVPEWALSGSAEYRFPFPLLAGVDTVLRTTFSYTDDSTTFFNDTFPGNAAIGDYFLMDLSASFVYDAWELKLFVTNVTDDRAVTDVDSGIDGFDTFTVRPRTFGVQVNWQWE